MLRSEMPPDTLSQLTPVSAGLAFPLSSNGKCLSVVQARGRKGCGGAGSKHMPASNLAPLGVGDPS